MDIMKQYKWDCYFLKIAKEVASKSDCLSRKIGAVIVKDKAIISTGYNGAPRGATHCEDRSHNFYMNLDYDARSAILMVNITHPVEDNTTHYIAGVKICLGESVFKTFNYTSQPSKRIFVYKYEIQANSGDKIKVAAYCNQGGEIHELLWAGSKYISLEIPGYTHLWVIFIFSVLYLIIHEYYRVKRNRG